jgi:hypothetical protein
MYADACHGRFSVRRRSVFEIFIALNRERGLAGRTRITAAAAEHARNGADGRESKRERVSANA